MHSHSAMPAHISHVKKIGAMKKDDFVYMLCSSLVFAIQTQPGFKIYCIGPRVLLQLWRVLGRRPHP